MREMDELDILKPSSRYRHEHQGELNERGIHEQFAKHTLSLVPYYPSRRHETWYHALPGTSNLAIGYPHGTSRYIQLQGQPVRATKTPTELSRVEGWPRKC